MAGGMLNGVLRIQPARHCPRWNYLLQSRDAWTVRGLGGMIYGMESMAGFGLGLSEASDSNASLRTKNGSGPKGTGSVSAGLKSPSADGGGILPWVVLPFGDVAFGDGERSQAAPRHKLLHHSAVADKHCGPHAAPCMPPEMRELRVGQEADHGGVYYTGPTLEKSLCGSSTES